MDRPPLSLCRYHWRAMNKAAFFPAQRAALIALNFLFAVVTFR